MRKVHLYAASSCEVLHIPLNRGWEAGVFNQRRMQEVRKGTDLANAVFQQFITLSPERRILGRPLGKVESHFQTSKVLPDRVVKLARHPPSSHILQLQNLQRKLSQGSRTVFHDFFQFSLSATQVLFSSPPGCK